MCVHDKNVPGHNVASRITQSKFIPKTDPFTFLWQGTFADLASTKMPVTS